MAAANGRLHADMDSNGWPQSGRNRASAALRKGFAFHFAGDQHLATIFHHGVDEHRDAIWSFCVPSIANLYLRWWEPLKPGKNREPGAPDYTGDHLDGFANKVTNYAAANPEKMTQLAMFSTPVRQALASFASTPNPARSPWNAGREMSTSTIPPRQAVSRLATNDLAVRQLQSYPSWGKLGEPDV